MYIIAHVIGCERLKNRGLDFSARGYIRKSHRLGRIEEAVEVRVELKNFTVVHAQPLPNRIAALNRAIKNRYLGVFARKQLSADVNENICISRIGQLDRHKRLLWTNLQNGIQPRGVHKSKTTFELVFI